MADGLLQQWLSAAFGQRNSLLDDAPMYQGGATQLTNPMPAQNFAEAPQNALGYVRRSIDPQTPNERMAVNVVRGFTESPAAVRSLPMDAASRAARAEAQGYTIDAYKGAHGYTGGPVTDWRGRVLEDRPSVPLTEFQSPGSPYAGFFSDSPDVASRFANVLAGQNGATVFPTRLRLQNPVVIDAQGKPAAAFQFDAIARQHGTQDEMARLRAAFEKGSPHDGVIIRNTADESTVYIPRAPQQVRSRHAAFDPKSKRSGDILASGAAGGISLGAILGEPEE